MEKVTSKDGTTIAFDRLGEGPALIMMGGALNDRQLASPLASLLASSFTVLNYDRRGRCDSTDTQPYDVGKEVDDLTRSGPAINVVTQKDLDRLGYGVHL